MRGKAFFMIKYGIRKLKIPMQSFRHELENLDNPVVEKDIIDLAEKISKFHNNELDEEKFRALRLARGVYGQRQPGVQMIRIKVPYGKLTSAQLIKIADLSDEYSNGHLHATTRQDIQIHYVSLDKTPELWAKLEQEDITLREACGNTVRNVTASAIAGVDPSEPFDVSPYAHAFFQYFLRNPICQEMGRKFKVSFSSSDQDSAFAYIHDLGFIPKIKKEKGKSVKGFKVVIGGGLGAQPILAQTVHEFLPTDQIIPFAEGVIRIFDRFGERTRRQKARLKFLLADIGLEEFLKLVDAEHKALKSKSFPIDDSNWPEPVITDDVSVKETKPNDPEKYDRWFKSNVIAQKQKDFYAVNLKLPLGNMDSETARALALIARKYAADDIRVTVNQGYSLRFVSYKALAHLFNALDTLGLAEPGFDSTADITACPGTDTCNLGISSSTGIAAELERVITTEYPELIYNQDIKIKISGCPNSCGQHGLASIGFHGSSLKSNGLVMPALVVLLGGGTDGDGNGRIAEKVVKIPSKNGPEVLRRILDNYEENSTDGEYFKDYYVRQGKIYFYDLLKELSVMEDLNEDFFIDWGQKHNFFVKTAVGECAGVIIDLVQTLFFDSEEKLRWAEESYEQGAYADAIYHAHNVFVTSAKALLLDKNVKNNSQMAVLRNFDKEFVASGEFSFDEGTFIEHVLKFNKTEPNKSFASLFIEEAANFFERVREIRSEKSQAV